MTNAVDGLLDELVKARERNDALRLANELLVYQIDHLTATVRTLTAELALTTLNDGTP